jgi:hypothetical protein
MRSPLPRARRALAAALVAACTAPVAAAPVTVAAIGRAAGEPAPPGAVRCSRFADGLEIGLVEGMVLEPGDRVWSAEDSVDLRLACGEDSEHMLSGAFQAFIDFPGDAACAIKMIGGDLDVLASQKVTTDVGGIILGNEGTQYAVRVQPGGTAPAEVVVFDGQVRAVARGQAEEVSTGTSLQLAGGRLGGWRRRISGDDVARSASVYARTDLALAGRTYGTVGDPRREVDELYSLHSTVLGNPGDRGARAALARAEIRLGLCDQAFYHLVHGDLLTKKLLKRYDIDRDALERNLSPGHRKQLDQALKGHGAAKAVGVGIGVAVAYALLKNAGGHDSDQGSDPQPHGEPQAGEPQTGGGDAGAGRDDGGANWAGICRELTAMLANGDLGGAEAVAREQLERQESLSCYYYALAKAGQARRDLERFQSYCRAALELHRQDRQLTPEQVADCTGYRVQ